MVSRRKNERMRVFVGTYSIRPGLVDAGLRYKSNKRNLCLSKWTGVCYKDEQHTPLSLVSESNSVIPAFPVIYCLHLFGINPLHHIPQFPADFFDEVSFILFLKGVKYWPSSLIFQYPLFGELTALYLT